MATALDESYPYDGQDAFEAQWREAHRTLPGNGVIASLDNEMAVAAGTGRQVTVATGRAWLAGAFGKITAQKTLALTTNSSGQPRIDRIVIRNNFDANQIELDVLTGTPGASPVAPTVASTSSIQEFPLARIGPLASGYSNVLTGDVHDERCFLSPYAVPSFADANALIAGWPLGPVGGYIHSRRSDNGLYFYDTAAVAWDQLRRRRFNIAYMPSGNEDTGTNATWPVGLHTSVAVPAWATRARCSAKIGQVQAVTGACNVDMQLLLGATMVDEQRVRWDTTFMPTSGSKVDLMLAGDVDCSSLAGTTVTFRTLANVVSGSGVVRATSETSAFADVEFR